jgi:hypothetical protein
MFDFVILKLLDSTLFGTHMHVYVVYILNVLIDDLAPMLRKFNRASQDMQWCKFSNHNCAISSSSGRIARFPLGSSM